MNTEAKGEQFETVVLEDHRAESKRDVLWEAKFVSPYTGLVLWPVGAATMDMTMFWDEELQEEVSFKVQFQNGRFSTKSPKVIRGMADGGGFNIQRKDRHLGAYHLNADCLPWPAREAWDDANAEGRRRILHLILDRQKAGQPIDSGYRISLSEKLMSEKALRERMEEGDPDGATAKALATLRTCPVCGGRKMEQSKTCRRCYEKELRTAAKARVPQGKAGNIEDAVSL